MRRFLGASAAFAAWAFGSAAAACTAESTIDAAKENRKSDVYKAAREVATDFIEDEKFEKTEATLDAGTGTLINESGWAMNEGKIPDGGKTAEGWKSILDQPDTTGTRHGKRLDGESTVMNYTEKYSDGSNATIRDHLRLHVSQWQDAMNGKNVDLSRWYTREYGYGKWRDARKSIDGSAPTPSVPAPVATAPPVVAPAPVPAPTEGSGRGSPEGRPVPEPVVELPVPPEPVAPIEEPTPEPVPATGEAEPVIGEPAPFDPDTVDHAG